MKKKQLAKKPSDAKGTKAIFAALAAALSIFFFVSVLNSSFPAIVKFLLGAVSLAACGTALAHSFNLECHFGLFLLKGTQGLKLLDDISRRHPAFWEWISHLGMVIGYGSLAYFVMGKKIDLRRDLGFILRTYAVGTFLLILVSGIIPLAMATLLSMVTGGEEFATAGSKLGTSVAQLPYMKYITIGLTAIGGIALTTTLSIITYALVVASAVANAFLGNSAHLENTAPGGMPILPGINLDLVQGVIALAVVLIVHEGMHGILARLNKLPLKSAGLVFFGFLPFGAFVDIDEKKLFAAPKSKQNAVLVAGTAANFLASLLLLILLIIFVQAFGGLSSAPPSWAKWTAQTIALCFAINAIVAAINLVPLPLFDGYHIMKNAVGNKLASDAIMWLVLLSFVLTMFPWVLR